MFQMNEAPRVEYALAPDDEIPERKVHHIVESPGAATVKVRHGHATGTLCAELTAMYKPIMRYGNWAQRWDGVPNRLNGRPQGLAVAEARWELVPANALPDGATCLLLEQPGRFVWLIHEEHASPLLAAEISTALQRIVGDGLWVQRWHHPLRRAAQPRTARRLATAKPTDDHSL